MRVLSRRINTLRYAAYDEELERKLEDKSLVLGGCLEEFKRTQVAMRRL